jgi:hypothetical protein
MRIVPPLVAAAALLIALVLALTADQGENIQEPLYKPMRALAARLPAAVGPAKIVSVEGGGGVFDHRFDFATGSVYELRRHGVRPLAVGIDQSFGSWYAPDSRRPDLVVRAACRTAPGRVLERVPEPGPCPVVVTLTSP